MCIRDSPWNLEGGRFIARSIRAEGSGATKERVTQGFTKQLWALFY